MRASYKDKSRMAVTDSVSGTRLWFVVSLTADLTQASAHAVTVQEMISPPTIGVSLAVDASTY